MEGINPERGDSFQIEMNLSKDVYIILVEIEYPTIVMFTL